MGSILLPIPGRRQTSSICPPRTEHARFPTQAIGDELLYSLLARYRAIAGGADSRQILEAAFGNGGKYAYVGLPGRLRHLAASLPGQAWTAERLAADHTVLPYFSRLLPRELHDSSTASWPATTR